MTGAARPPTRFEIPETLVAFLSASTAAGNASSTVAFKERSCPDCTHTSLFFCVEQSAVVTSGRTPRRQFQVVAHCRTPACTFRASTNGRFTIG